MITFYTACKADRKPIHDQYSNKVICGSVEYDDNLKQSLREEGFILDEDGENISNLNWTFADVANIYYVWRNAHEEFLGVNQYKRYWKDGVSNLDLKEDTLYVPERLILPVPLINHIKRNRETKPEFGVATDAYLKLCLNKKFSLDMSPSLMYSNQYIAHNMFIGHRKTFKRMCEILFEHLYPIYDNCKTVLPREDPYHARQMGFISEVVIDNIIKNRNYFFGKLDIVELPIYG